MTRDASSDLIETNLNSQSNRHVSNQLIVKLKKEFADDPAARQQVLDCLPGKSTVDRNFDKLGFVTINLPEGADPSVIAQEIQDNKAIEYAEPNFIDSGTTT